MLAAVMLLKPLLNLCSVPSFFPPCDFTCIRSDTKVEHTPMRALPRAVYLTSAMVA